MNDFTKDELICIRDNIVVPDTHKDKNILLMAYNKLLGMIDNYCEHEWRCWDDEHNTRECMKCDEKRTGEIT